MRVQPFCSVACALSLQVEEIIKIVDFELGYASGASMSGRDYKVSQCLPASVR